MSIVETFAATPITSLAQTEQQPLKMIAPPVMKHMTESGFMDAMMNEAMMSKLGGLRLAPSGGWHPAGHV